MPVKGWRPVAAIHNAKSERSREEHKEYMEKVAPRLPCAHLRPSSRSIALC